MDDVPASLSSADLEAEISGPSYFCSGSSPVVQAGVAALQRRYRQPRLSPANSRQSGRRPSRPLSGKGAVPVGPNV